MRITKIDITNFRKLENISVALDENVTLIVGRNNSGKTSLTELIYKFIKCENSSFSFDDFSIASHCLFIKSLAKYKVYKTKKASGNEDEIELARQAYIEKLPFISAKIYLEYKESDDISALSDFILDLDSNRKDALISCNYQTQNPESLFDTFLNNASDFNNNFVEYLDKKITSYYKTYFYAVDKENPSIVKEFDRKLISNIFITGFISAQRDLDDQATDRKSRLSKGFEDFYRLNKFDKEADIKSIESSLVTLTSELNGKYDTLFQGIFTDLKQFGIENGAEQQDLTIRASFESEKVLRGNTKLFYKSESKLLPEAYNGLGYSNLIYITLQFVSFFESYSKAKPKPAFQLIFIEEPEAHLHPQMQTVFIKNIEGFIKEKANWNVQIVLTTHSSQILTDSNFNNIRYFDSSSKNLVVKNLSDFISKLNKTDTTGEGQRFLTQYMSLGNCNMFFADKIIMVEGTVERILLPKMIRNFKLKNQYISIIEIGGAYAHKFKELLEFINVKTLIITDIDSAESVKKPDKNGVERTSNNKCPVDRKDSKTTNYCLVNWLPKKSLITDLLSCPEKDKVSENFRIAYQIPEEGKTKCGRSFEEAFFLCNASKLAKYNSGIELKNQFSDKDDAEILSSSYEIAEEVNNLKSTVALDILQMKDWSMPKYINEGLKWLEE